MILWKAIAVFFIPYLINVLYITVFYHRGLAHNALSLSPWTRRWVIWTGNWLTGIDPKGWVCMHRLHHLHSDTREDPHTPVIYGVVPLIWVQLKSYRRVLRGLLRADTYYTHAVRDLDFPVNALNRGNLWFLPHLLHLVVAAAIAKAMGGALYAVLYWLGIMSHPVQGWLVNAFGHAYGYRNFDTPDNSKNNWIVSALIVGEGYQNNHHQYPNRANFAVKWWELDIGYALCLVLNRLGVIRLLGTTQTISHCITDSK